MKFKLDATLAAEAFYAQSDPRLLKNARLLLDEKTSIQSYTTWLWEVGGVHDTTALPNGGMPITLHLNGDCWGTPDQKSQCEVSYESPCGIPIIPAPTIDIKNSDYYIKTESCNSMAPALMTRNSAENKVEKMQEEKDKAQGILDSTLAKKEAASKALNEAKNAKKCN